MTVENVLERTVVRAAAPGGGAEAAGVETGSLLVALDGQSTKVCPTFTVARTPEPSTHPARAIDLRCSAAAVASPKPMWAVTPYIISSPRPRQSPIDDGLWLLAQPFLSGLEPLVFGWWPSSSRPSRGGDAVNVGHSVADARREGSTLAVSKRSGAATNLA